MSTQLCEMLWEVVLVCWAMQSSSGLYGAWRCQAQAPLSQEVRMVGVTLGSSLNLCNE